MLYHIRDEGKPFSRAWFFLTFYMGLSWTVTLIFLHLNCSLLVYESMINILQESVINSSLQCSHTKGKGNIMSVLLHLTSHFNKYLKEQRVCSE